LTRSSAHAEHGARPARRTHGQGPHRL